MSGPSTYFASIGSTIHPEIPHAVAKEAPRVTPLLFRLTTIVGVAIGPQSWIHYFSDYHEPASLFYIVQLSAPNV